MRLAIAFVLFLTLVFATEAGSALSHDQSQRAELILAWQRYEAQNECLAGTIRARQESEGKMAYHIEYTFLLNGARGRVEERDLAKNTVKWSVINSKYAFSMGGKGDAELVLYEQAPISHSKSGPIRHEVARLRDMCNVGTQLHFFGESLTEALKSSDFAFNATTMNEEKASLSFKYPHSLTREPFNPIQNGTVHLLNAPHRLVKTIIGEIQNKHGKGDVTVGIDYTSSDLPASYTRTYHAMRKGGKATATVETFSYDIHRVACSDDDHPFTLTYFGKFEPSGIDWPRPTPWWLYISLTGGVLFIVGLFVLRRRRAA